jgi:hypothetical protein
MLRKGPGETPGPFAFPLEVVSTIAGFSKARAIDDQRALRLA